MAAPSQDSTDGTALLARYRAMAEEGSDIIVLHEQGRIVLATGALYRLLKRTPEEFQSGGYLSLVHPDDLAEAGKLLGTPPRGEVWTATYRVQHADGYYLWFEVRTRGVYDEGTGAFLREVSVGREVTERKENELRLQAAQQQAEAANRAKSALLANMSHELRTPLNAIIGFADLMRNAAFGPLSSRYLEYADSIHEAGQRLLGMLGNILDLAQIESGRFDLHPVQIDVDVLFSDCIGLLKTAAEKKGVDLQRSVAIRTIAADPAALRKILLNLLSNAVAFTPAGGCIRVEIVREAGAVLLRVRDTGSGMSTEQLETAAQPFAQLCAQAALARGSAGMGLGLPLVRALAEAHGGDVAIESGAGAGTTVTVRLPDSEKAVRAA
jgi:PAS domain S-box-containing protein